MLEVHFKQLGEHTTKHETYFTHPARRLNNINRLGSAGRPEVLERTPLGLARAVTRARPEKEEGRIAPPETQQVDRTTIVLIAFTKQQLFY